MDHHKRKPWHALPLPEVLRELETTAEGLSDAEAANRLKQNGKNELRSRPPRTLGQMLRAQLLDPMVLILIGAAILSAVLREWTEASVIGLIVVLNAVIGIVQEKKAQSSLEALRQMSAPTARVLRQGEESVVPAAELVVGDIVQLRDGDMVPADLRLIDSANLKIQEASLTGESVPVEKDADQCPAESYALADRCNMAYSSSIVTYGRAEGVVVATGMQTQVGDVASILDSQDDTDTPLKRKLNAVGKVLTAVGVVICVLIFAIGALYGRPMVPQLLVAISLAISIIPEGLPATATIVMALGVRRMARQNALIRKLPAVETLGSATVICSDKTGTLTLNKMTVKEIYQYNLSGEVDAVPVPQNPGGDPALEQMMYAAALCNDASFDPDHAGEIIGDPTEGALLYLAQGFGIDHEALEDQYPRLFEQPFDSGRKRMTTVHRIGGENIAYTKGAVEELLERCARVRTPSGEVFLTEDVRDSILTACHRMSERALRVLGFASRILPQVPEDEEADVEWELVFLGAVGMIDPPRKEVAQSVHTCREAGIRTVMITGDHRDTALAIAGELGICGPGDGVLTGDELEQMRDEDLDRAVPHTAVFARVSPADKLRIVRSLQRTGEVAAMTGDGVNDAPALKAADIGVAMGCGGTDVAKDAADMILLDDSFTTIAYAIREGRRVYRNIQKVIQFLLAGNIAEITTLLVATLINWDAPLQAVHILWVNLATATLPALALGVDPPARDIMHQRPVRSGTLFERDLIGRVLTQGIFVAAMTTVAYWIGVAEGSAAAGQTMAFCVLAFSQMLRALDQRSNIAPIWQRGQGHNPWLWLSFAVSAVLVGCILLVPPLQTAFKVVPLSAEQFAIAAGLSLLSLVQIEAVKVLRRLRARIKARRAVK